MSKDGKRVASGCGFGRQCVGPTVSWFEGSEQTMCPSSMVLLEDMGTRLCLRLSHVESAHSPARVGYPDPLRVFI